MAVANILAQNYEHDFIEAVPDRLMCSTVCTKVLKDPHLTSCCGQHICETCLDNWFEKHHEKSCPHCRAKGGKFNHFLDKKLKREIAELKIRCIHKAKGYKAKGCEWTGELGKLDNHIRSDNGCGFVKVKCPKCIAGRGLFSRLFSSNDIFRKDLHEHMNNKCRYRSVICTHCKENKLQFFQLEDHYKKCPQYPLSCPNECGVTNIPRENMPTHRDECPLEPVQCPFAEAGCQTRLVRNQLKEHTVSNQQEHLLKLMADYRKTKTRLEYMQEGISRELRNARVTRDLQPTLKAIQTILESPENKIN